MTDNLIKSINLLKTILNSDIIYSRQLYGNCWFTIKKYGIELIYYKTDDLYLITCQDEIMYKEIERLLYDNNNILDDMFFSSYNVPKPWIYIKTSYSFKNINI